MRRQPLSPSQRSHWYENGFGRFVHVSSAPPMVSPTRGVPTITGAVWFRGSPGVIRRDGTDMDDADPLAFVAVTVTRSFEPTSAVPAKYKESFAPTIVTQLPLF